jgi:hypothetical protein
MLSFIWKIIVFIFKFILAVVILATIGYLILSALTTPSNTRPWAKDMAILASAKIENNLITIKNIRDAKYRTVEDYDLDYYTETFDLSKITAAYLFTDPFGTLSAHTMMGFEFSDGKKVILSVEVRREIGEWFSGIKGMLRQYEIIYVWSVETDVVKLRTNIRKDNVYMYKMDMAKKNIAKLFTEAIIRTNELYKTPEFYNTLFNNCTTNLINQLQKVYDKKIILDWKYLAPAYAEQLGIDYDLITNGKTIEEVRQSSNISPAALKCNDCQNYSESIRSIFK